MKKNPIIACIGWGSLIWKPEGFPARGWRNDGPYLPIEFCRHADDNSLALVLLEQGDTVPTLWTRVDLDDLAAVIAALAQREGTTADRIGFASEERSSGHRHASLIWKWAVQRRIDAVVWTALPPKFGGEEGRAPTEAEALDYLAALSGDDRAWAEEYVRRTPPQIRTRYRVAFERELGGGFIADRIEY